MKRFFVVIAFVIRISEAAAQEELKQYLRTPHKGDHFNGTALVVHKGEVLLHYAQGIRDVSSQRVNDTATIYRIGSLSKPFTALLILQLMEEGLVSLDADISTYLPDYPDGNEITVRQLLTHSSGVKEYLEIPAIQQAPDSAPPISMDSMIALFAAYPAIIRPREKLQYSNSNYILLARIAEKVTGEKYEHLVRKRLFETAGMEHSGFDFKNLRDTLKATGHFLQKGGLSPVEDFDSTYAPGCGSMYTNVTDLYRAYNALMGNRWISKQTRDSSFLPRQWRYGYGWFSYQLYGLPCISHPGGVPGFYSHMQFFPTEDLFVVILSNTGPTRITTDRIAGIVLKKKARNSGL